MCTNLSAYIGHLFDSVGGLNGSLKNLILSISCTNVYCCCFGLGLFPAVSRIISIPSLQKYKQFTLELLQLNPPINLYNLSVSPGRHQGTESVINRV